MTKKIHSNYKFQLCTSISVRERICEMKGLILIQKPKAFSLKGLSHDKVGIAIYQLKSSSFVTEQGITFHFCVTQQGIVFFFVSHSKE